MFSKKIVSSTFTLATLSLLALTGCSASSSDTASTASASATASTSSSAASLTVANQWVKAAESGMTAVFGELTNQTDQAITITGASSSASKEMTQLHTTELDSSGNTSMKQVESFTIEPGQTLNLEPGGNHIMVMDMTCSLPAGSTLSVSLETSSGEKIDFEAGARDYTGAKEEYAPGQEGSASAEGHDMESMEGMDMSSMSASALPQCG